MKQEIRAQLDDLADTLGCLEAQLRGSSKRAPDGATRLSVEQAERNIELYRRDIVESCRNGAQAARALADVADCQNHSGPQQIATGSTSVFINSVPAARLGDNTVCDARISTASANVFIGGGTAAYAAISAEVSPLAVTIARDMAIGGTAVALGAGAGAGFLAGGWAGAGVFGLQAAGGDRRRPAGRCRGRCHRRRAGRRTRCRLGSGDRRAGR